ncbi:MAG: dethiobiotin synthase [Deltaproteobacteria bacterium]|nr:dethiobiotin synthase [Deltaproteobacteria bacterium]
MARAFFITGTDTNVGKTFVSILIARALKARGIDVGVMKPVETGCAEAGGSLVPTDALALKKAAGSDDPLDLINPYRFSHPLSPNVAARLSGVETDLNRIESAFKTLSAVHEIILVEGAGGLLVPLNGDYTMADVAIRLSARLLIVAASKLGAINHALLTVECAKSRGIDVAGVILNHPAPRSGDASIKYNRSEIERYATVLAEVPYTAPNEALPELPEALLKVFK